MNKRIDVNVFNPNVNDELTLSDDHLHERTIERVGIESKSCLDVMDTDEMQKYLKALRATAGSPEDQELEKRQQRWLASNAAAGKQQRQLSHRELHNALTGKPNTTLNSQSGIGLLGALKKIVRIGAKKNDKPVSKTKEIVLAKEWRRTEMPLPGLGETIRKVERDRIYNFDTLYRQVIFNFADQVGQLPASESHHHNWPGGLLKHSLEVADMSFQFAKSQDIEAIGLNDIEAQRRGPWQYAAFVIGLLHDVGKSITDMNVHGIKTDGSTVRWNPSLTTLNQFLKEQECERYFVDMNPTTRYVDGSGRFKRHEGMASVMLERILTPEAIHFITSSPDAGFGLWEQITSILSGKSGHHYLESSLKQAEQLSVYRSFTKARSTFHLKDRRRSVAEVYIEQLHRMRKEQSFLKHVFNIGGSIFIRYPEGLNMIQRELRESPVEGAFMGNYTPNEILKFLESAAYIKRANEDRSIVKILKTKFNTNKKNSRTYEPDGGSFTAVMLEHPTLLFGNDKIPDAITAIVYISEQKAIEFFSESECQEYVEDQSKVSEKKHKSHKGDIAVMLDAENKWNIVSHNVVEPEEVEVNGERIKSIAGKSQEVELDDDGKVKSKTGGKPSKKHSEAKGSKDAENGGKASENAKEKASGGKAESNGGSKPSKDNVTPSKPTSGHQEQSAKPKRRLSRLHQQHAPKVTAEMIDEPPTVLKGSGEIKTHVSKDTLFDNPGKETGAGDVPYSEQLISAYAEWARISEKNAEAVISGRIPVVLFQAPFFVDKAKEFDADDWASNGMHVARKNDRTVVLKQSFIDLVKVLLENTTAKQESALKSNEVDAPNSTVNSDITEENQVVTLEEDPSVQVEPFKKSQIEPSKKVDNKSQANLESEMSSTCKSALLAWGKDKPENMEMLKSGLIPNILLTSGKLKELGVTVDQLKAEKLFLGMKGRKVQIKTEPLFDRVEEQALDNEQKPLNNVRPQDTQSQVSISNGSPSAEITENDNEPPKFDDIPLEAYGDDWRGEEGEYEMPHYSDVPDEFSVHCIDQSLVQKDSPSEQGVDFMGEDGNLTLSELEEETEYVDVYELTSQSTVAVTTGTLSYQIQLNKADIMSMFQSEQKTEMGACTVLVKGIQNGVVIPFVPGAEALDVSLEDFVQASTEFLEHKMNSNACPKMKPEQTQLVVKTLWSKLQVNDICTLEIKQGD
ncbi:TraI domain-containing protein [Vibrio harveyi]|uniref:TraI domain-containing protein n=1 Tax=Vibrio harveyi TaxID=669 RepID=UPI003BB7CC7A